MSDTNELGSGDSDQSPLAPYWENLGKISRVRIPRSLRIGVPVTEGSDERRPMTPREKVETLESHMLLVAEGRNMAEEDRILVAAVADTLEDKWDDLQGWEMHLGKARAKATQADFTEAKRKTDPSLYTGLRECKRLLSRLSDQISRLKQDEDTISRLYTMVTG